MSPQNWPVAATLRSDDFLLDSHRKIFGRMRNLAESSRPIELITVTAELDCHRELQSVGGVGYVASLTEGLPDRPLDSLRHYVNQVRRAAGIRRIVHATDSIREQAEIDPSATIAGLRSQLSDLKRDAAQYESESGARITRIQDIPDPFTCLTDEIGWIVNGLIPARGVTIIAGEAGAGKTWLALLLAQAITFGNDFLGRSTLNTQVLYLDRENPLSLVRDRLKVLFGGASKFRPWGLWCQDEPPLIGDSRLLEFAKAEPLIIIDSMIRFHRADENSATQMAPIMAFLRELATAGASIVVLHHKAKSETSSYRGSSDIIAGADAAFALSKRDGLLELKTIKNRFAAEASLTMQPDYASGTFVLLGSQNLPRGSEVDRLANIIQFSPGLTQNELIKRCGIQRQRAIDLLRCHDGSRWQKLKGTNRSLQYFPVHVVSNDVLLESGQNHHVGTSEGSSHADSKKREPLGITKVVPVRPPLRGGNRESLEYYGT
jgi:archaellum biogenesis ATPase FlaH